MTEHNIKTKKKERKSKELVSSPSMKNNILSQLLICWASESMQMTVSEGFPLNSKFIKMGREAMRGGGFSSRWSEMSKVFHVKLTLYSLPIII